jgi:hypothetical protein
VRTEAVEWLLKDIESDKFYYGCVDCINHLMGLARSRGTDLTAAREALRLADELIVGRRSLRGWGVDEWKRHPAVIAALGEKP